MQTRLAKLGFKAGDEDSLALIGYYEPREFLGDTWPNDGVIRAKLPVDLNDDRVAVAYVDIEVSYSKDRETIESRRAFQGGALVDTLVVVWEPSDDEYEEDEGNEQWFELKIYAAD